MSFLPSGFYQINTKNLLFWEIVGGIATLFGFAILFVKLTHEILELETLRFDINLSNIIYSWRTPELTRFFEFISYFGEQFIIGFVCILIVGFLYKRKYQEIVILLSTVGTAAFVASIVKNIVARPRPTLSPLVAENNSSFPSIHTTNAFVFYSLAAYFIWKYNPGKTIFNTIITLLMGILASLVGLSRIYLGVHYPTDVLGGIIMAGICLITVALVDITWEQRRSNSTQTV